MPYFDSKLTSEPGVLNVVTEYKYPNGAPYYTSTQNYRSTKQSVVETRTGTKTPGYNNPNRSGLLPVNPYRYTITRKKFLAGSRTEIITPSISAGRQGSIARYNGVDGSNPDGFLMGKPIDPTVIQAARRALGNRLLNKVKDQKVNLAQAYAERAQTKNLIADNLLRLAHAAKAARRGDLAKAAKHLGVSPKAPRGQSGQNAMAQNWLALQYGWKPLISDIYGVVELYHKKRSERPIYERVRVVTPLSAFGSGTRETTAYSLFGTCEDRMDLTMGATFSYRGSQVTKTLAEIGISNPLLLAWELLPWSFVADWFIPVGGFLELLDATNGVDFVQGFTLDFRKTTYRSQLTYKSRGDMYVTGQGTSSQEVVDVARSYMTSFPSPAFPSFRDPYTHTRFANAYALFRTNFRK